MDTIDNEPSDLEVMRLVAYVAPDLSDEDDFEPPNLLEMNLADIEEYLIDYMSPIEAVGLGNEGILNKVAETLYGKNVISLTSQEPKSVQWRLISQNGKTLKEKQELTSYTVTDLRILH